jgi:hypothetical protein
VGDIVHLHLTLKAVFGDLVRHCHDSSIQNETVESCFLGLEGLGCFHDALKRVVVHEENLDVGCGLSLFDFAMAVVAFSKDRALM